MLDLRVITFLKVCETMNYTKAAEELHMTQPAVTKQIQALEAFYQTKLLLYQNRSLVLTDEGRYLWHIMNAMEQDIRKIKMGMKKKSERMRIRIGGTLSIGPYSLDDLLPDFISKFPDVDVSITVADTRILLEQLEDGRLDFIFCEGNFKKDRFESRTIREVPLVVFYGANYKLGEVNQIEDLFAHTLLLREQGSGTREIFENYLKAVGYSINDFKNHHEFNHSALILSQLERNKGISVLYENVGESLVQQKRLKKLPFKSRTLSHEFNLIWKRSLLPEDPLEIYREYLYRGMCSSKR